MKDLNLDIHVWVKPEDDANRPLATISCQGHGVALCYYADLDEAMRCLREHIEGLLEEGRAEEEATQLTVGQRVYWDDPDEGSCSGYGTVVELQYEPVDEDTIVSLKMEDEAEVEALPHELTVLPKAEGN